MPLDEGVRMAGTVTDARRERNGASGPGLHGRGRRSRTAIMPSVLDGGEAAGGWTPPPSAWSRLRIDPDFVRLRRVFGPAICIVALQFALFSMPAGVYLYGLVLGVLGALVAVGMALVYRANRIVNFAQAQLGVVPATLATALVVFNGVSFPVAFAIGLTASVAMGAAVDLIVIQRFKHAPRLVLTVATIGFAQLLSVTALGMPFLWGRTPVEITTGVVSLPFSRSLEISPITFTADHLFALVTAPLCLWCVSVFFRKTPAGIAVRAAAERADRAALLGVPVARLETLVWVLAAVLSFLGVFLRATVLTLPLSNPFLIFGTALGALAALTLGRMDDLPSVAASAVALGILEQGVLWNRGDTPELVYPIFALVVAVGLGLRQLDKLRDSQGDISTWQTAGEIRPMPRQLRRLPEVRLGKVLGIGGALAIALVLPNFLGSGEELKASAVLVFAIVGLSVVVLTGWAGQVSLGQMAFAGYGAAWGSIAFLDLGWDAMLAIPVAGLFGAAIAVLVGLPALKLRGIFLAAITLAFSVGSASYVLSQRHMDWIPRGRIENVKIFLVVDIANQRDSYYLCLGLAVVLFAAMSGIRRSRTGRVLMALRENELAAQAHGISVTRAKLTGFALSGALAAMAGCVYVVAVLGYSETLFQPTEGFVVFTSTVVGGIGSMAGAIIGALFSRGGTWFLHGNWVYVPSAVGVLLVLWLFPSGIGGALYHLRDRWLRQLAARRGIDIPALRGQRDEVLASPIGTEGGPAGAQIARVRRQRDGPGPLLEVRDLDVAYGDVQVLFGVDLDVAPGEVVALLGTNGSGKSTLLKTISGLLTPSRGTVELDGRDITRVPAHQIVETGVVQMPGGHGVFPSLTVAENLRMACWLENGAGPGAVGPTGPVGERVQQVLELFPTLQHRMDNQAGDLSGGGQQMLSLAMALLVRPRILLIDELSLGLAPIIVAQLLDVVRAVAARGTAVVLVEQSVNVALNLAERAVFMEKGQVRFSGPTAHLLDRPDLLRSVFLEGAKSQLAPDDLGGLGSPGAGTGSLGQAVESDWSALPTSANRAPLFELRGVTVSFGGIRALDDVAMAVEPGEIVGIIGPNGAGKTTLFDVISGVTRAERGLVLLDGVDVARLPTDERARGGLGRSFQDARLYPALTVEETLAVALDRWQPVKDPFRAALRLPVAGLEAEVEERVDELIALLGLEQFRDKFTHELSTGSRRIVDLACVLAHHPSVVLLDEPSSGIAQREAEALGPLLRRVRDVLGATMIVIEHDMSLIASVADRLVALDQGQVIAAGSAQEVLHHPAVVASYLGSSQAAIQRSGARTPTGFGGTPAASPVVDFGGPGGPNGGDGVGGDGSGGDGGTGGRPRHSGGGGRRPRSSRRPSRLRTYAGPIGTALAVFTFAVAGGLGRAPGDSALEPPTPSERMAIPETSEVPLIWQDANREQQDTVQWVQNCDPNTGRIMMPTIYAPPCVPAYNPTNYPDGSGGVGNGDATTPGVTADTITVAIYVPQAGDLRQLIQNAIDPEDAIEQTGNNYVAMMEDLFETYGRRLNLIRFNASGAMDDEVAARADALRLFEEVKPFAVIGGPPLTTAFAEELAARGIFCFDCGLATPDSFHQDNAPFIWGPLPTPEEFLVILGDFLFSRVLGHKAEFAGDPDMRDEERRFGIVRFEQKIPVFAEVMDLVDMIGSANGLEPKANEVYIFDLEKMPERATQIIAKMKSADVTSIVFVGDPIMPIYLTQAATAQHYFPEWIITGTVLTDSTVMGRQYDQQQWAHAFGLSNLPVKTPVANLEAYKLHQWYFGTPPPAKVTAQLIMQSLAQVFLGIHLAGPNLTPATFRDGLFNYPPTGGGPTTPRISYGHNGLFISEDLGRRTDYLAVDDMAEVWWDADAVGPDEIGVEGKGMWRFANGGKRYLPGEMPETPTDAFREEGSVLTMDDAPPETRAPDYPPPARGAGDP
ncbi:MAG TPA: ATP-binding cassette domain-containing protein [Acidimicrobiales bacterium]|jgi:ABC-type branched-subunit amino acid transport system ATPase component/ABC-type branched-subunit amino acid transport system permease subunit